jgi:hypothetical protein
MDVSMGNSPFFSIPSESSPKNFINEQNIKSSPQHKRLFKRSDEFDSPIHSRYLVRKKQQLDAQKKMNPSFSYNQDNPGLFDKLRGICPSSSAIS